MAEWPWYACRNPNCKSNGQPHPNCKCQAPSQAMSEGGEVEAFCAQARAHARDCQYFAEGGPVEAAPAEMIEMPAPRYAAPARAPDDTQATIAHAALSRGFLGLVKEVGNDPMADPDSHHSLFDEAKMQHQEMSTSPDHPEPMTLGSKLGHRAWNNDHEGFADDVYGHPVVSGVPKRLLPPIMQRLAPDFIAQPSNPQAFRASARYLASSAIGAEDLEHLTGQIFEPTTRASRLSPSKEERDELKDYLEKVSSNPEQLLETGGSMGHYLPEQASQVAATTAEAIKHLDKVRPKINQENPLDTPTQPTRMEQAQYERQLDIVQQPQLIFQHIKDGTLQTADLDTLQAVYPGLKASATQAVTNALIDAKAKGKRIPWKSRTSLSMFLGQPLDYTQTSAGMQAILKANSQQAAEAQGQTKPPTAATAKAVEKADEMYETPLQKRQANKYD